jgi:hypothetical protein
MNEDDFIMITARWKDDFVYPSCSIFLLSVVKLSQYCHLYPGIPLKLQVSSSAGFCYGSPPFTSSRESVGSIYIFLLINFIFFLKNQRYGYVNEQHQMS